MEMHARDFLESVEDHASSTTDRSVLLIWWASQADSSIGLSAKQVAEMLEAAGHAKQNVSRINSALTSDRRTVKASNGGWKLHPSTRRELDERLKPKTAQRSIALTDSVLPNDLFVPCERRYITGVVEQINKSFDAQLYDCCAVMCRRLIETLIIELYESQLKANDIKGADGHFFMLSGLISALEKKPPVALNRSTVQALPELKKLGDLSAHNRHYLAKQSDIARWRDAIRSLCEELLHKAKLI